MTREELKKEAQEQVNYHTPLYIEDFIHGYLAGAEPREKQIVELEKENAELKVDNDARKFAMTMSEKVEKQLRNERNTFLAQNEQYEKDLIDFNENLTKAKEIIKKLIEAIYIWDCKNLEQVEAEAKQFLSEVEK